MTARTADYKTFNYDGVTSLVFAYVIAAGEHDGDGIAIPADAINLNGGTITDSDSTAGRADPRRRAVRRQPLGGYGALPQLHHPGQH